MELNTYEENPILKHVHTVITLKKEGIKLPEGIVLSRVILNRPFGKSKIMVEYKDGCWGGSETYDLFHRLTGVRKISDITFSKRIPIAHIGKGLSTARIYMSNHQEGDVVELFCQTIRINR